MAKNQLEPPDYCVVPPGGQNSLIALKFGINSTQRPPLAWLLGPKQLLNQDWVIYFFCLLTQYIYIHVQYNHFSISQ